MTSITLKQLSYCELSILGNKDMEIRDRKTGILHMSLRVKDDFDELRESHAGKN